jgi:phospholipid/cholesterol/gamma-HCH transport system substrate-binding protein
MKRQNEILVGLLTTAAIAILIAGTYWLARGSFARGYDLYTVTNWGQSLKTGQKVLFAGVAVGHVDDVELRMEGKLVIKMLIEDRYRLPRGSTAAVQPADLFGGVIVAITPPPVLQTQDFHVKGDTLPAGKPGATPADIMAGADSVTRSLQAIMRGVQRDLIDAGAIREMRNTLQGVNRLVSQLSEVVALQSAELSATMVALRRTASVIDSASIDSTLNNVQRATSNLAGFTAGLEGTGNRLTAIVARLDSGQGTAGKLLNDDSVYRELQQLTADLRALLADFRANPRKYLDFSFSIFGGRR